MGDWTGWIGILLFLIAGLITLCAWLAFQVRDANNETERVLDSWNHDSGYLDWKLTLAATESTDLKVALAGAVKQYTGLLGEYANLQVQNRTLQKDISESEDDILAVRASAYAAKRPFNPLTATPVQVLAQAVATEAGPTATYAECRAIAQVMINRMMHRKAGTTILDVVTEKDQFTAVSDGRWVWAAPTDVERAAAYNAWNGIDNPTIGSEVLYFCARGHEDEFFKTELAFVIAWGDTSFYKEKEG